ncbi:hypothetical protein GALL_494940 [mine drainage metagenome]|uniref:Uncharacterized protein n=1 Tax=mine drainage metagenome TaxID=410659 RepID=A0A1J5PMU0_9ZZZZ
MRQHSPAAEQSEAVQTFGIGHAMSSKHIAMLPIAFRTVGLDVTAAALCQRAQTLQGRIGAGGNEARCHDGLHQCRSVGRVASDVTDQVFRAAHGLIRRGVAVKIGTLLGVIHHHLADQRALAGLQADIGENTRGLLMNGRKIQRRGGAIGNQVVDQQAIAFSGKGHISVASFQRKGIFLQPDLERDVERAAELRVLRRVNMQVDESRQQIGAFRQGHKLAGGLLPVLLLIVVVVVRAKDGKNCAVMADGNQGILKNIDFAALGRMEARCHDGLAAQVIHKESYVPS